MKASLEFRSDIQVLRAIAVLAVVLYHANEKLFSLGYLGVDAFFLISGFVISPLILRITQVTASFSTRFQYLKQFYVKRFLRLAPALGATFICFAPLIYLIGPISDHQKFSRQGIATLLLSGNFGAYRYTGDYFFPSSNPLIHTWSLSVEEQIYLFLPIGLILFLHNRAKKMLISTSFFTIITAVSVVSFCLSNGLLSILNFSQYQIPAEFSFYSPIDRLWQFSLGSLLYLLLNESSFRVSQPSKTQSFFVTLFLGCLLFGSFQLNTKVASVAASLVTALVIGTKSLEVLPRHLYSLLVWIGNRSYSIYLVHMPLIYLSKYSPVLGSSHSDSRWALIVLAVISSIVIGSIFFQKVESRYKRSRDPSLELTPSPRSRIVIVVLTFALPFALFVGVDRSSSMAFNGVQVPVAEKTLPWDWDAKCRFFSTEDVTNSVPCKYGDSSQRGSILLIGDSHAASISRAIVELGAQNSLNVYVFTHLGCGFVTRINHNNSRYDYPYLTPKCLQHNRAILGFVKEYKPDAIIWSHRSSSIFVKPNDFNGRVQYNKLVESGIRELNTIVPVINVGSGPELVTSLSRVQDLFTDVSFFSKIPSEDAVFWKNSSSAAYFLDILPFFCKNGQCRNWSKGRWLFHDTDHLSTEGAKLLIPGLESLINEILSGDIEQ